jgi:hypothetical protein
MASTVKEIMNHELFSVRPTDTTADALNGLLAFGIYGAPVVDSAQRPVGVISLRDVVFRQGATVADRMSSPAVVVRADARISDAAKLIAETGYRRLVVVDDANQVVGMLSAVDVIRGLVGLPVQHPVAFPHLDAKTGLQWTDDAVLDTNWVEVAPDGPGLLLLIYTVPGTPDLVVWAESANNVQTRLLDILSLPQENPELNRLLGHRTHLRFRAASVTDPKVREQVIERLRPQAQARHPA